MTSKLSCRGFWSVQVRLEFFEAPRAESVNALVREGRQEPPTMQLTFRSHSGVIDHREISFLIIVVDLSSGSSTHEI